MISLTRKSLRLLICVIFSSNISRTTSFQYKIPCYNQAQPVEQTFIPFRNFLHSNSMNHFSELSNLHIKEESGKNIVLAVSSALPKFDTVGHNILSANHDFIFQVLHNDFLTPQMKKEIILLSIRLAQMGDDMGSQILQYYYNLVDASL